MMGTIKERLEKIILIVLDGNKNIPSQFHPLIKGVIKNFLKDTSEDELRELINKLRSELIPFILGEDVIESES